MGTNAEVAKKWLELTERDMKGAQCLLAGGNYELACYHCQQALEKILKAYIFAVLGESDTNKKFWTHDLVHLAKISKLELSEEMRGLLFDLNPISTDARYEMKQSQMLIYLSPDLCKKYMAKTEEFVCWIKNRL